MGEHLASHGYVVAYVERQPRETVLADGPVREALVLAEYVRDMEVAIGRLTLLTEAHPRSANAFDSLSEALEAAGQRGVVLKAAERALSLLPDDTTVPAAERVALEAGLKARIQRNRGPG
jgi:hypothetical protein